MSDGKGAYEHSSGRAGFGDNGPVTPTTGPAEPKAVPNEIDVQGRQRGDEHHGPETQQDTRIAEAEGLRRRRERGA